MASSVPCCSKRHNNDAWCDDRVKRDAGQIDVTDQRSKAEWGRLLMATDFSPCAERAYGCAVGLARNGQSEICFLHVIPAQVFPYLSGAESRRAEELAKQEAARNFARWESREELKRIRHCFRVVEGRPVTEISRLMEADGIDVVVMGTRGNTSAEKFLLGAVAEEIFRIAKYPVLTVGAPEEQSPNETWEVRRIVYASNLTPYSDHAAKHAFSLAEKSKAKVTMVHVVETSHGFNGKNEALLREFFDNRLRKAIPNETKLSSEPEIVSAFGSPGEQILRIAEEREADLIVLGVRAAQKMPGYLPSRTAYRVVCQAKCPVLTVPHCQHSC
jgi:nucleotide-binding universal stress UspA family protein